MPITHDFNKGGGELERAFHPRDQGPDVDPTTLRHIVASGGEVLVPVVVKVKKTRGQYHVTGTKLVRITSELVDELSKKDSVAGLPVCWKGQEEKVCQHRIQAGINNGNISVSRA